MQFISLPPLLLVLLGAALRGTVVLLFAGGLALLFRRASAAIRHGIWTFGLVGLLLTGPLAQWLPAWPIALSGRWLPVSAQGPPPASTLPAFEAATWGGDIPVATGPSSQVAEATNSFQKQSGSVFGVWALRIWGWGACLWIAGLALGAIRLGRRVSRSVIVTDPEILEPMREVAHSLDLDPTRLSIRWTEGGLPPMVWGLWHPVLMLPRASRGWGSEGLRRVLIHELAHVQRWDLATQMLANIACALFWFHPLVWMAAWQMLVERERACDDVVLRDGAKASDYAHQLLEMARACGARWSASRLSPAMARRSQISGRLLAVLDPERARRRMGRRAWMVGGGCSVLLLLPLTRLTPVLAQVHAQENALNPPSGLASAGAMPQSDRILTEAEGAQARQEILAATLELAGAFHRKDWQRLAECHTEDAQILLSNSLPVRGREGAKDLYLHLEKQGFVTIDTRIQEWTVVGTLVCTRGQALYRGPFGLCTVQFMTLWKQERGQWRIHRSIGTQ